MQYDFIKSVVGGVILIWIKAASLASKAYTLINKNKVDFSGELPEGFTVTCHAGALFTSPNTLRSVRTAVEWGAQIVEFDVSFRPDGTPVIIHNSNPAESEGVLLAHALPIVAMSNSCQINLDIKSTANLAAVDELVKQNGLFDRVFYTGVFEDWVEVVRGNSNIPYYLNYNISEDESENEEALQAVAHKSKSLGAIGINSNYKYVSDLFVDTAHENGLLVSLWTANKIEDICRVLKLKPDNITTKHPAILNYIIKK